MKSLHLSIACRSPNCYRPSIALWQQFVLPIRRDVPQQRLSSTPAPSAAEESPSPLNPSDSSESILTDTSKPSLKNHINIRKAPFERVSSKSKKGNKTPYVAKRLTGLKYHSNGTKTQGTLWESSIRKKEEALVNLPKNEPVVVQCLRVKEPTPHEDLPWPVRPHEYSGDSMERLNIEMKRFAAYTTPGPIESLARNHLIEQVRADAQKVLPHASLDLFGSERTGLALATSDIDLRLIIKGLDGQEQENPFPPTGPARKELRHILVTLQKAIYKTGNYIPCSIRWARYPLIAMTDRKTNLEVQIVASNDSSHTRGLIAEYKKEFPYLQELWPVVKSMFLVRGFTNVFNGGFGGYSLFMMTVASLRHSPPAKPDAANGLMAFLKFWGELDVTTKGVSIEPVLFFDKAAEAPMPKKVKSAFMAKGQLPTQGLLCLRDPADPTNDLGRKGTVIKHVQATCRDIHEKMLSNLYLKVAPANLLRPVIGDYFDIVFAHRRKLVQCGKALMIKKQEELALKAKEIEV